MKQLPEDIKKKIEEKYTIYDNMYGASRRGAEFGYHLGVEQAQLQPIGMNDKKVWKDFFELHDSFWSRQEAFKELKSKFTIIIK